jgi:hypothetical protein
VICTCKFPIRAKITLKEILKTWNNPMDNHKLMNETTKSCIFRNIQLNYSKINSTAITTKVFHVMYCFHCPWTQCKQPIKHKIPCYFTKILICTTSQLEHTVQRSSTDGTYCGVSAPCGSCWSHRNFKRHATIELCLRRISVICSLLNSQLNN